MLSINKINSYSEARSRYSDHHLFIVKITFIRTKHETFGKSLRIIKRNVSKLKIMNTNSFRYILLDLYLRSTAFENRFRLQATFKYFCSGIRIIFRILYLLI